MRVHAYTPNKIGPKEFHLANRSNRPNAKKVGQLGSLDIFFSSHLDDTSYTLLANGKTVGLFTIASIFGIHPHVVEYSVLAKQYVGKGLGLKMHEWLLNHLGSLASDESLSVGASITWARLVDKHKGLIVIPKVKNHPVYEIQPQGWVRDAKGFIWPKVKHNGKLVGVNKIDSTPEQRQARDRFFYKIHK